MSGVVGSNLTIFKREPTIPQMSQHVIMYKNVALACCNCLAAGLKIK